MKFILELWPDLGDDAKPGQLLKYAIDSIGNGMLKWDIVLDDGHTVEVGADMSHRVLGPNDDRWIGHPRAKVPPTDAQFSDRDADQQLDWLLRAVTEAGGDVNQRRYDLEDIARIVTEHPQAGYGRMPIDTDVHGEDCIICKGEEDFSMDPPGLSRDGHPYVDRVPSGAPMYVVDQVGATHVFLFQPHAVRFAAEERAGGSEEVVEFTLAAPKDVVFWQEAGDPDILDRLADYACSHGPEPETPFQIVQRVIFEGLNTMAPGDALDITAHDLAQEVVKALNQKEN